MRVRERCHRRRIPDRRRNKIRGPGSPARPGAPRRRRWAAASVRTVAPGRTGSGRRAWPGAGSRFAAATGPAGAVSGGALGPHAGAEARWGLVVMGWSRPHVSDGGGIGVQVRFPGPRAWPHAMTASNVTVAAAVLLTRSRRNLTAVPPGRVTVVARQQGMTARPRARQAGLGCTVTGKS